MTIDPKPVRSLLFVPANREDRMHKALTTGADAVVFDLESAIPRGEATAARAMVRGALAIEIGARPGRFVRVSAVGTEDFARDLDATMHHNLDAVLLPQVRGPGDVHEASAALDERDPGQRVALMPLVETAAAARSAYEVANASPRVAYLGGAVSRDGDIARAIGYRWTPGGQETLFLRSKVLLDARAAGVVNPLSGIWSELEDLEGLSAFARQSRDLGYEGLMCIHPRHIPVIHEIFTPTSEEIEHWRAVVDAMEAAQREGLGAIRHQGRLIDVAHLITARQNLTRAARLGLV